MTLVAQGLRWAGHVARVVFGGRPEGTVPLGKVKCSWEDNTKMCVKEIRCYSVYQTDLGQDRASIEFLCTR